MKRIGTSCHLEIIRFIVVVFVDFFVLFLGILFVITVFINHCFVVGLWVENG